MEARHDLASLALMEHGLALRTLGHTGGMSDAYTRRYVSALRAPSAARLYPDETIELNIEEEFGQSSITIRTRYEKTADTIVHRELWLEVVGPGTTLDETMRRHSEMAATLVSVITLATNAVAQDLQLELTFDATASDQEHEIFQNCIEDETGLPRVSRHIDSARFLELFRGLTGSSCRDRLFRATSQYKLAIQHLQPGQEILALAHLYMAMEVLTRVARDDVIQQHGSREEVLKSWNIELKMFDSEVRRRVLFQGDNDAYRDSKSASDGFEHGHMDFSKVHNHAVRHARPVAGYVRQAILRYCNLPTDVTTAILGKPYDEPLPSTPMAKYLRATLVGEASALAPADLQYPMFKVQTAIGASTYENDRVEITPTIQVTNLVGDSILVRDVSFEFWGPETDTQSDT